MTDFCDEFIESGDWGGTYCKLEAGHDGEHSVHYPASCGAVAPNLLPAMACLMPKGHPGPHQAGDDGEIWFLHDARETWR